jgi:serine/threonine-protein kinase SRK2
MLAVEYCHAKGICIRDIKLGNILFVEDPRVSRRVKICDFGFSKDALEHSRARSKKGSPYFVAPEIIEAQGVQGAYYEGNAADIWSIGVTLYVMAYRDYPFDFEEPKRADVTNLVIPETPAMSPNFKDLLRGMLKPEPGARYTARQVMTHPWFRQGLMESERNDILIYNDLARIRFDDEYKSWVSHDVLLDNNNTMQL